MAVKTHVFFYMREDGEGANICVQIVHFMCPQEHKGYAVAFNVIAFLFHDAQVFNGVALMFLRAHGRKSMPVCLEALLFLCPFVLMFSADLVTHKPYVIRPSW